MGIQGLLPFLKKSSRPAHVREFKGCVVAVDAYVWLHKGAFACAEKLAKGEKTDQYVTYCMKYVRMLLSHGITPILVFDGQRLPSKASTELKRRENRLRNRAKAKEYLREGKLKEARECFQRCVDVTSAMALDLIKACRACNVDCIVAPYEADAQLAYLNLRGIADLVITEDSDLLVFGCTKVLFKMDVAGGGCLVEQSKLGLSLQGQSQKFNQEKFRRMCIMSGCDYLPSLPGIGLGKAFRFFCSVTNPNLAQVLPKIPSYLKMPQLEVTPTYVQAFIEADNTFLYQLVYDPLQRELVPLTAYPSGVTADEMPYAGTFLDPVTALQLSLGNLDVNTLQKMDDFHPDYQVPMKLNTRHSSIWAKTYHKPSLLIELSPLKRTCLDKSVSRVLNVTSLTETTRVFKRKREEVLEEIGNVELNVSELCSQYLVASKSPVLKRRSVSEKSETTTTLTPRKSCNPFAKRLQHTVEEDQEEDATCVVVSPYFVKKSESHSSKSTKWLEEMSVCDQPTVFCPANYELLDKCNGDSGIGEEVLEEEAGEEEGEEVESAELNVSITETVSVKEEKKSNLRDLKSQFGFPKCKELYTIPVSSSTRQPFKPVVRKSSLTETEVTASGSSSESTTTELTSFASHNETDRNISCAVEMLTPPPTQKQRSDEKRSCTKTLSGEKRKAVGKNVKRQLNLKDMFAFHRSAYALKN